LLLVNAASYALGARAQELRIPPHVLVESVFGSQYIQRPRWFAEAALLELRPDVRFSAKRLLVALSLMSDLDDDLAMTTLIKRYAKDWKAKTVTTNSTGWHCALPSLSSTQTPTDPNLNFSLNLTSQNPALAEYAVLLKTISDLTDSENLSNTVPQLSVHQSAQCLIVLMTVAQDFNCPKTLTESLITALAPFGNSRKFEKAEGKVLLKDVQDCFQGFLKDVRQTEYRWSEFQKKLSKQCLEMVDQSRGHLGGFL